MINNSFSKAEWCVPTRILLGKERFSDVVAQLDLYGYKRPVIICDKFTANSALVKSLIHRLDKVEYFFGCYAEDTEYVCDQRVAFACNIVRKGEFDCVIALGPSWTVAFARLVANIVQLPTIVLLLTAGNATELLPYVFSYQTNGKVPQIKLHTIELPKLVIFDIALAGKLHKDLLVDSALAILVHAIEAWCVNDFDPLADNLSLEATKIMFAKLPQLIIDSSNYETHSHIFSAAIMAALACVKRQGASTVLAQCLSFMYGISYGKTAGLLVPHVLTYNLKSFDPRLSELANKLGIKGGSVGLAKALLKLRRLAGVPSKLTSLMGVSKIKRKEKLLIEQIAVNHPLTHLSPIRFTQKAASTILNAAIIGKMKRK